MFSPRDARNSTDTLPTDSLFDKLNTEEIGMVNFSPEWGLEEYDDPASKLFMQDIREAVEKLGRTDVTIEDGMNGLRKLARDHARTPMQWSDGKQAGFSQSEKTW